MAENPVEELEEHQKTAATQRREHEHKLWETWNQGGRKPEDLEPLLNVFAPVVAAKTREWKAPRLNENAFKADIHTHMIKAFETYNPNHGASLRTHIEHRIQKSKRYNAKNQNFAYIPEEPASFIGKINKAKDELMEEHGRDPTHQELAAHVSYLDPKARMTPKKIKEIMEWQRPDLPSSGWSYDPAPRVGNREQEVLGLIQAEITSVFPSQDERAVFEYIYGLNGKPTVTGTNELAAKLGKSPSQVSRIKKSIGNKVKSYL